TSSGSDGSYSSPPSILSRSVFMLGSDVRVFGGHDRWFGERGRWSIVFDGGARGVEGVGGHRDRAERVAVDQQVEGAVCCGGEACDGEQRDEMVGRGRA